MTLAESVAGWLSGWTPGGESVIFTHPDSKLYIMPARGGKAEEWLQPQQEGMYAIGPVFLSVEEGMRKFVYGEANSPTNTQIIAFDRASGQHEILAVGQVPVYDPSGHVIYEGIDPKGIWAIPFSVHTMKATGNPFPISETGTDASVSRDGMMVYLEGPPATGQERLVWRDREGNPLGTIGEPQDEIRYPNLSPDGRKVAVTGTDNGNQDIWIHEVGRPVKTNFTTDAAVDIFPTWSPSGDRIAFSSARQGDRTIYTKRVDGGAEPTECLRNAEDEGEVPEPRIRVVQNWYEQFRDRPQY